MILLTAQKQWKEATVKGNHKISIYQDQYLNYLALELLEILGSNSPLQEQIDRAEILITYHCKYLNYLAIEFLKLINNNNVTTSKKIKETELLLANFCKKYLGKNCENIKVKEIKSRFLRKHRVIKDNV